MSDDVERGPVDSVLDDKEYNRIINRSKVAGDLGDYREASGLLGNLTPEDPERPGPNEPMRKSFEKLDKIK